LASWHRGLNITGSKPLFHNRISSIESRGHFIHSFIHLLNKTIVKSELNEQ